MDPTNGLLSYSVAYDLDRPGTASQLLCEVYISDNQYRDTAYLNITILDRNDNTPTFEHTRYTFIVPISTAVGTVIGQVCANDDDVGTFGKLSSVSSKNIE